MTFPSDPVEDIPLSALNLLDRRLVSGITWTLVFRWVAKAFSFAATLYAARILTPGDYGLVAMAAIPIGLAPLIGDLGLGAVSVQNRKLSDDQLGSLATSAVALGGLMTVSFIVLSGPIAVYFREVAVATVIVALSLTSVIDSIQVLPRALLQRDLEFRTLAWLDGLQATIAALVLAGCATLSLGYWALVLNTLVSSSVITIVLYARRPFRLQFGFISRSLVAGWRVAVSRMAWYGCTSLDSTFIGRILGKDVLGVFGFAMTFASLPNVEITAMVSKVVPGIFSSVQESPPVLRRYFLMLTEAISYLTLPISCGLALTADDFVRLALGPRWEAVILPLRILCLYQACNTSQALIPHVLLWTGHFRANMWLDLFSLAFLPTCFYVGLNWGAPGVAWAWALGFPLIVVAKVIVMNRIVDLTLTNYLSALRPALIACVVMSGVVLLLRAGLPMSWSPGARLAMQASVGALTYIVVQLGIFRPRFMTIYKAVRVTAKS